MNFVGLHEVASVAFERMVYSLAEGLLLTFVVAIALRLLPAKASQTRFAIWLSALFGIVVVTVFGLRGASATHAMHSASLFSLPVSIALGAFALWALAATLGVVRIGVGLWQLGKLRRQCEAVSEVEFPESVREMVKAFQSVRPVAILRASDSHSPKAVGFFRPAIILPAWLLKQSTGDELKHVLLHEMAHLRRRDDWTNLLQQVVKALFFFHPAIWWMERELALSREQACDDAALEQTADAHDYARSLALVAEKSFIRRQVALAQAILGRAHQLTQRVTRILDPKRPTRNRIWKPAVPLVALAAAACGFSASWTPALVGIQDSAPMQTASVQTASVQIAGVVPSNARMNDAYTPSGQTRSTAFGVKAWPATMKFDPAIKSMAKSSAKSSATNTGLSARHREKSVPALRESKTIARANAPADREPKPMTDSAISKPTMMAMAKYSPSPRGEAANSGRNAALSANPDEAADGLVVVVATQQTIVADPNGWHVEVSQVRWVVPAKAFHKPAPNKT